MDFLTYFAPETESRLTVLGRVESGSSGKAGWVVRGTKDSRGCTQLAWPWGPHLRGGIGTLWRQRATVCGLRPEGRLALGLVALPRAP